MDKLVVGCTYLVRDTLNEDPNVLDEITVLAESTTSYKVRYNVEKNMDGSEYIQWYTKDGFYSVFFIVEQL